MRDRLIELLKKADKYASGVCTDYDEAQEVCADYLIAEGVIVPPCKVEQTVYGIYYHPTGKWVVFEYYVTEIIYCSNRGVRPWIITCFGGRKFDNCDFGKTVFLTREEAEKALAERRANDGT